MNFSDREKGLLYELQRGLPLEERPFAALGAACGFSEDEVIAYLESAGVGGRKEAKR